MTLDEQLEDKGMIPIAERMLCNGPMDGMMRHAQVQTLSDLLSWVEMARHENMEMVARHDLGIHPMSEDIADFIYGKGSILWEVHVNLLHIMKGELSK
jgi:activator of HSP90 ATPase